MRTLNKVAMGAAAALAIAAFSIPAEARHGFGGGGFGGFGGHVGFARGMGHAHFAHGGFDRGFRGRHLHGFVGFYPYYAGYYDPYYEDDYYYDDGYGYCYWRHGRRFCRY